MRLFTGILCLCVAILGFLIVLLGCRNPRSPRWANDFLVANVYSTGIIALVVLGCAQIVRFAFTADVSAMSTLDLWLAGGTLAAAIAGAKALRVRKTLASYAATEVAAAGPRPNKDGDRPEPPAAPPRPRLAA